MNKLKNNGFTLVELLAVIVILGIVMTIVIPNVGTLINKNKEENQKQFVKSIKSAAKLYISDYKYKIILAEEPCDANNNITIKKIDSSNLTPNSQIKISTLINEGYITTNKDGTISNPANKEEILSLEDDIHTPTEDESSYITVKYNCKTKDYVYSDPNLFWIPKN